MPTHPYDLVTVPDRDEILAAYELRKSGQTVAFEWFAPPDGTERLTSRIRVTNHNGSGDVMVIEGEDVGVKQGPNKVRLTVDFRTNTGEIVYL